MTLQLYYNVGPCPSFEASRALRGKLIQKICIRNGHMNVKIKKLSPNATIPTKAHLSDAGWDLYSSEDICIGPGERALVSTNISMSIPNGFVGLIWPRSGLSVKKGIDVLAGVIDATYRGEVKVCLLNTGKSWEDDVFIINAGDRIAQILFQEVPHFNLVEVQDLDSTDRAENGFGSSGV
jgi:dUTP pyrophosphatase